MSFIEDAAYMNKLYNNSNTSEPYKPVKKTPFELPTLPEGADFGRGGLYDTETTSGLGDLSVVKSPSYSDGLNSLTTDMLKDTKSYAPYKSTTSMQTVFDKYDLGTPYKPLDTKSNVDALTSGFIGDGTADDSFWGSLSGNEKGQLGLGALDFGLGLADYFTKAPILKQQRKSMQQEYDFNRDKIASWRGHNTAMVNAGLRDKPVYI